MLKTVWSVIFSVFVFFSIAQMPIDAPSAEEIRHSTTFFITTKDNKPIKGVAITLFSFDGSTNEFRRIHNAQFGLNNPVFSDDKGTIKILLPSGKYKAKILYPNMKRSDVEFNVHNESLLVPISLEPAAFSLITALVYTGSFVWNFISQTMSFILNKAATTTQRAFFAGMLLGFFIALSYIALYFRTRLPLTSWEDFFKHKKALKKLTKKDVVSLRGRVMEHKHKPIEHAHISLINYRGNVLNATFANRLGDFALHTGRNNHYKLRFYAPGYRSKIYVVEHVSDTAKNPLIYYLPKASGVDALSSSMQNLLSISYESVLIASLILGVFMGLYFGWNYAAPFLMLSCINVGLWIVYRYRIGFERKLVK